MGDKDIYFSYDIDSGKTVSKTQFEDNGQIDRYDGINHPGHSHERYKNGIAFGREERDPASRLHGEKPDLEWEDREHILTDFDKK